MSKNLNLDANKDGISLFKTSAEKEQDGKMLTSAKELEAIKITKGYRYMLAPDGKTSYLTSPEKIEERLNSGFKLLKK